MFWLVQAPNEEAADAVHREAHRLVADSLREHRQQRLDEKKRAFEDDRNRAVEAGLVPLFDWPKNNDSRVHEQHVKAPKGITYSGRDERLATDVRGVGFERHDTVAKFGPRSIEIGRGSVRGRNARAFGEEEPCCFRSDAARRTGNESPFPSSSFMLASPQVIGFGSTTIRDCFFGRCERRAYYGTAMRCRQPLAGSEVTFPRSAL